MHLGCNYQGIVQLCWNYTPRWEGIQNLQAQVILFPSGYKKKCPESIQTHHHHANAKLFNKKVVCVVVVVVVLKTPRCFFCPHRERESRVEWLSRTQHTDIRHEYGLNIRGYIKEWWIHTHTNKQTNKQTPKRACI